MRYEQFGYFCLMGWLTRVFRFYLDASIHVAFAVISLLLATTLFLNISPGQHLIQFVFFGTIPTYNFIKYGVEAKKYILLKNHYHRQIQIFSLIMLIIAGYHFFFLSYELWFICFALALLIGLYALPVFPMYKNLRSLGVLKVLLVALVWTGTTVIIPVIAAGILVSWDIYILIIQQLILILILLIPFEIRDLDYDQLNLKTIPQRLGVTKTIQLGILLTVIFFLMTFLKDSVTQLDIIGRAILFLILLGMLFLTRRHQSEYFASFYVESIPIGWLGILKVLENYF
ncbi:hypothetical protein [uncultured Eudoraea sp.]|uniref:hypothetical protein n=1 Tax=uncultured Eudoraea sp. TaxID=1035614 RepID=UPI00261BB774|nr:hypothetical protein [uncultured Eudoraea sp.]